jgi:hypothetical protein
MARPGLSKHPKFRRLVKMLNAPMPHVRGYLELLWEVAYENGNPVIGDATDVALACEYPGKPDDILQALLSCGGEGHSGFIDPVEDSPGRYEIHNLFDHAPDYVKGRMEREVRRQVDGLTITDLRREAARKRWDKRKCCKCKTYPCKCHANAMQMDANDATPAPAPAPVLNTPAVAGGEVKVSAPPTSPPKVTPRKEPTGDHPALVQHFRARWQRQYGKEYVTQTKDAVALAKVLKAAGTLERACEMVNRYLASEDPFLADKQHPATMLLNQVNRFTSPTVKAGKNGEVKTSEKYDF